MKNQLFILEISANDGLNAGYFLDIRIVLEFNEKHIKMQFLSFLFVNYS